LAVGVGSFCDPEQLQGLSHYLEHMLFMGSEKFPNENEYDEYLTKNGGSCNAFTEMVGGWVRGWRRQQPAGAGAGRGVQRGWWRLRAGWAPAALATLQLATAAWQCQLLAAPLHRVKPPCAPPRRPGLQNPWPPRVQNPPRPLGPAQEATNFYFDVQPGALRGALDRFAQFFVAPLCLEGALEREVLAVDSEFSGVLQSDGCRLTQLMCHTSSPGHLYRKFSWGNRRSLWDAPREAGVDVRAALLDHHGSQYSAERMALVVLGGQPLPELRGWAEELFGGVRSGLGPRPDFSATPPPFEVGAVLQWCWLCCKHGAWVLVVQQLRCRC
jgi:hypothetical protein